MEQRMNRITATLLTLLAVLAFPLFGMTMEVQITESRALAAKLKSLDAKVEGFILSYPSSLDSVAYGSLEFCTKNLTDEVCQGKDEATQLSEGGIPIAHVAWGWVIDGSESDNDYNDQPEQIAAGVAPDYNEFKILKPTSTMFGGRLCIEVHFKDNSEFPNMVASFSGKTVALCAVASDVGQSLINIDCVDDDNSDGCSTNSDHARISGWRCFNPHGNAIAGTNPVLYEDDLGNAGDALGYVSQDGERYRLLQGVSGIFAGCFPAIDSVNND